MQQLAIVAVVAVAVALSAGGAPGVLSQSQSQPAWSSVVTYPRTGGISVSSIIGGVEDPAHMGINCSCVDRHKARILFVPDLLDSSYAGKIMSQGAQRAAIDMGVQLHITPSRAFSTDTMAQSINQARGNTSVVFFPSYPGSPDWVISGLPSSSVNVEPLASLLSMYATAGIPFSSVHSANLPLIQQLAQSDSGHVWHVGADNLNAGQVAAEQLMSQMADWVAQQAPTGNIPLTDLFTPFALCFNDMIGLEAGDDRCQGWSSVWSSQNVSVLVRSVNSLTADYHPVLNLIQAHAMAGRALPIFAVDDEAMGVVMSAKTWGEPQLTTAQINQPTLANSNISVSVLPLWIATVDVSLATANSLSENNVLRVALDQQPFIQGYLSVALAAMAVRTGTFPSQLLYQTGPVVVDRSTMGLIPHAQLEQAGYPECTAANSNSTSNSNTAPATPSTDVPCFNRSTVKFQSTFHAAAGPAGAWAAPLRAGIYQSSVDMRVRVDDLLQTVIDPSVNMAGYAALNAENNLPVAQRAYQGMMMVRRGANQVSLPMVYNLTEHGMPIVTINNFFGACCAPLNLWQNVTHQAISHVGSDDATISRDVAQHLLSMGRCTKLALLDPDGSWSTGWQYTLIIDLLAAGGVNASFVLADSSNPAASLSAISAAKAAGYDCWLLGTNDPQIAALIKLNIAGNPAHRIGVWDFDAQVLDLLQQGSLSWSMSQGMFYQGYLPPMFLTLLWLTGGPERGNRLLKTNNMTNEDSYYSYVNFPYVESGPQFLTPRSRGLARLANCAPADAGLVPPTMTLPALVNIKDFPFARMAFPVCLEPPPHYYAVITTPDMIQRFQPHYDTNCPAGPATSSPSWCAFGPANSTNTPSLSYTLDSSSYVPTSLIVVLLNYAQQLVPTDLTSQWLALLNNNNLLVASAVVAQNSSWPGFDYSANSTSLLILGSSSAPLVGSMATFPAFGLQAPPGTAVSISFGVTLLDGQRIQTNTLTLTQPPCVPGQYAQIRAVSAARSMPVCTPCQSGYTSYHVDADQCSVITSYIPVSGAAAVQGIIGFMMLLFVGGIVCIAANNNHPMVRSFSPVYCCISLAGVVMVLCGALLMLDTSAYTMVRSATASVYLFNMGFTLAFGAVWTKLFRLFRIFNNPLLHMIVISNAQLFAALFTMVAVDVIIVSVWLSIAPYHLRTDKYQTCVSDKSDIFNGILIGTKGALMLSAAWLTYNTRAIPSRFNETKAITFTIYNTAIISGVLCFLWLGLEGAVGSVIVAFIKALGTMLGAVSFVALLFSPLLRVLYKHARGVNLENPSPSSSKRKSSFGKSLRDSARPSSIGGGLEFRVGGGAGARAGAGGGAGAGAGAKAARDSSAGVETLVREHGAAFQLGKGDLDMDLEEGLAGLLAGSDALDAVVKELRRREETGSIHPLELGIINAHREMISNRNKVIQHYRKYKRAIMTIALINAQFQEAKRTGTLDQYEIPAADSLVAPAPAPAPATARRRSDVMAAANAYAYAHAHALVTHAHAAALNKQAPRTETMISPTALGSPGPGIGTGTGTDPHENDRVIKSPSHGHAHAHAGAAVPSRPSVRPTSTAVDPKRASISTSTVQLFGGGALAGSGLTRTSSMSTPSSDVHMAFDFQGPPSPQHQHGSRIGMGMGMGMGMDVAAADGPPNPVARAHSMSSHGRGSISISQRAGSAITPNQIELMPQSTGGGRGPGAARNFV